MGSLWSAIFVVALLIMTPMLASGERAEREPSPEIAQVQSEQQNENQPNIFAIDPELLERATGSISAWGRNGLFWAEFTLSEWRFIEINVDKEQLRNSEVELEIELASLSSWVFWRLPHILGPHFLDVEQYPIARVRLYEIRAQHINPFGVGRYRGMLELEVKGVVNHYPLTFNVTGRYPIRVEGEMNLLRTDFGIGVKPHPLNIFAIRDQLVVKFSAEIPDQGSPPRFPIFGNPNNRD